MTPRELSEEVHLDTVTDLSRYTSTCLHGQNFIHGKNSKTKFLPAKTQENDNFSDLVIDGDEGGISRLGPTVGAMGQSHNDVYRKIFLDQAFSIFFRIGFWLRIC
jgi:hypothetical protein